MNTFTGPFRLMMREMSMTFYINVFITFALFVFYNVLGYMGVAESGSFILFGPLFVVFLLYPFINFSGYQYILSLGGTRKQFVLAFYLSAVIYSVLGGVILNLFYFFTTLLTSSNYLFHFAKFIHTTNWLIYFWIDFSWIFFLFSLGMIAKTVWFNYGTAFLLAVSTILLIIGTIAVVFGDMSSLITTFLEHHLKFVTILFGLSIVFLLLSYSLMKNAHLEKGGRLNFKQYKQNNLVIHR
ncbi:hypothetical protein MHH96_19530 [Niallia sp. FSL K6-0212]|uniref:hypothetical protein n=1 Tax=Niallia sp. FSL K6-0212 TaxID=2921423 RepID=UPI0030FA6DE5